MRDVDVVIVNWNSGSQLEACVRSITDESVRAIFVVDNGSTDGSIAFLERTGIPRVRLLQQNANRGFAAACNIGARAGRSESILFLNPDTVVPHGAIAAAAAVLESKPAAGIVGIQLKDDHGATAPSCRRFPTRFGLLAACAGLHRIKRLRPERIPGWNYDSDREVDQVMGAFCLVRRGLFEELGGFDERFFVYFEDLDLALRVRQAGFHSHYFSGAWAYHHGRGTTDQVKTRRLAYYWASRIAYAGKHFGKPFACVLLGATLCLEPIVRVIDGLIRRPSLEQLKAAVIAPVLVAAQYSRILASPHQPEGRP